MDTLGQRIRMLRVYRDLTQSELAIGICSASAISQMEADKICPSVETLTLIAKKLRFPVERLVHGADYTDAQEKIVVALDLMDSNNFAQALGILEEVVNSPVFDVLPSRGHTLFNYAICLLEEQQCDRAIPLLEEIVKQKTFNGIFTDEVLLSDAYTALAAAHDQRGMQLALKRMIEPVSLWSRVSSSDPSPRFVSRTGTSKSGLHVVRGGKTL